jgi:uncharacterized cofD-like protein
LIGTMHAPAPHPALNYAPPPPAVSGSHPPGERPLPRIVALGGGTGLPALIEGLCGHLRRAAHRRSAAQALVTAVVAMTDDGGSSGTLRRTFGVQPPGDARNCLLAGVDPDSPLRALLQYRFEHGTPLEGHPVGNLLLTVMSQMTGSSADAISTLSRLVRSDACVLPVSTDHASLRAELASGAVVKGESAIALQGEAIRRVSMEPAARPLPEVMAALLGADAIVVGPGSLYTSLLPTLLVQGIAATIYGSTAARVYVANLMTQPGETDGFSLDDHLRVIRQHTGFDLFDYILVNRRPLDPAIVSRYADRGSAQVSMPALLRWAGRARVVEADFAGLPALTQGKIRHDPASLGRALLDIVDAARAAAGARCGRE